jgi:DNA-directed RNA polymerase
LESGQYDRALAILDTLEPLSSSDKLPFVDDLNRYLQKWSQKTESKELMRFISSWGAKYNVSPNGRTVAILVNSLLQEGKNPTSVITDFGLTHNGDLKSIFSNLEILGIRNLASLVNDYGYDLNLIPYDYRNLIHDYSKEYQENDELATTNDDDTPDHIETSSDFHGSIDELPPSLPKGDFIDLKAVDTFGMKVIRHTLLALKPHLNKKLVQNMDAELVDRLNFLVEEGAVDESKGQINFFKIYKSLPEELQEQFEESLDLFNQERQKQLENRATLAAQERWKHDYEELKNQGSLSVSKKLNATLWRWSEDITPLIREEIELCKNVEQVDISKISKGALAQHKERLKYAPFFSLLSAQKMSAITILELLKLNSTGGVNDGMRTARAVVAVSKALELEFRSEQLLKSENAVFKDLKKSNNLKKYAKSLTAFKSEKLTDWKFIWPHDIKVKIGSLLISMLMHVAKVSVEGIDPITKETVQGEAPAFYHSYQYQSSVKVGVLKIHRSIGSQLSADSLVGTVQPQLLPMLVKPRPWTSYNSGGYLYSQGFLIRSRDSPEQMAYLKASSDSLDQVYKGLNVLGETAWTVNERVFNVMSLFWNKGEEFLDIPPVVEHLDLPEQPPRNSDPSVIFAWKKQVEKLTNNFNNYRSIRCDANYKLEIARAYLGEKMYFPHNLDFRGRAYPLSPNLNHLGNDLSRGLLIFWKGKKLGPQGLDWLKVHLSNLFGIDKAPLSGRIQYANDNLDKVFKTAEDPIAYQEWWTSADKPWQALATIFELAEALKHPNPEEFISHQPVHQDGTCNGLQHYAALGGDIEGARQVNLVPSEKPQDVYSYVANLVIKRLNKAAGEGDEVAEILKDKIKRKVVKQTVMTNVYGVTYIGATAQIDKQLADIFPNEDTYKYSVFLTKHVFACIRELFEGAHLIQDWLAVCAKLIASSVRIDLDSKQLMKSSDAPPNMASVIWTTPLNLPIVQPYRAMKKKQISTNLQTIYISDPFAMSPVDPRKQMAAFPPNYIHSLDATHMLMSSIACYDKGIQFASVHDSYWTHAGDVDIMNAALRDAFIKLHEVDLIETLKNEFDQRYKGFLRIVKIPRTSDFGKRILRKRTEISKELGRRVTISDEIYLERERQRLLNSEKEEDVARGKAMVTTVSILEGLPFGDYSQKKRSTKSSTHEDVDVEIQEMENELNEMGGPAEAQPKSTKGDIRVLAPLVMPDIPPKGDFDVQDLRESKYFFS